MLASAGAVQRTGTELPRRQPRFDIRRAQFEAGGSHEMKRDFSPSLTKRLAGGRLHRTQDSSSTLAEPACEARVSIDGRLKNERTGLSLAMMRTKLPRPACPRKVFGGRRGMDPPRRRADGSAQIHADGSRNHSGLSRSRRSGPFTASRTESCSALARSSKNLLSPLLSLIPQACRLRMTAAPSSKHILQKGAACATCKVRPSLAGASFPRPS